MRAASVDEQGQAAHPLKNTRDRHIGTDTSAGNAAREKGFQLSAPFQWFGRLEPEAPIGGARMQAIAECSAGPERVWTKA